MNLAMLQETRRIQGVGADEVEHYVPLIRDMYEAIAKRQENIKFYTVASIVKAIQARDMQLWIGTQRGDIECGIITEVRQFPAAKVLTVLFVAGKAQAYFPLIGYVFPTYAKAMGCSHWSYCGRPGWSRIFRGNVKASLLCYQEV